MSKLLLSLFTLLALASNSSAAILCPSASGGAPYNATSLASAAVSPSCKNGVVVTSALSAVQSNISSATVHAWPAGRALKIDNGGSISNSTTFAINGNFQAPLSRVFAGAGSIVFGSGSVTEIPPEWFGPMSGDNSAILSAAINASIVSGIPVSLNNDYNAVARIIKTLTTGQKLTIYGNGHTITTTTSEPINYYDGFLDITGANDGTNIVDINNLTITHPYWNTATTGGTALGTRGKLAGIATKKVSINLTNVTIKGFANVGAYTQYLTVSNIKDCDISQNLYAGFLTSSSVDVTVSGGVYNQNGGDNAGTPEGYGVTFATQFDVSATQNMRGRIVNITAIDNIGKGVDVHDCQTIQILNNYIKGFKYSGIYAVNEGATKIVSDITIIGNTVDGGSTSSALALIGIQAGSYGVAATSAENVIVSNNIIKNTNNPTSLGYGILIENAKTGGASPKQAIITGNTLQNSASTGGAAIKIGAWAIPILTVDISNNSIYQSVNDMLSGITIGTATNVSINSNKIIATTGTVAEGIYPGAATTASINNNILAGGATFTAPITIFGVANQNAYGNIINGIPYRNIYNYGISEDIGTAIPTGGEGYFYRGSHRKNSASTVGQPKGWYCTVSGITGGSPASTWVSEGNL